MLRIEDLDQLGRIHIGVVGDIVLDHYIRGYTERTSPEAPVPVVVYQSEDYIPGGAANVAHNIVAAGAGSSCVGVVGNDREADILTTALATAGVVTEGIGRASARQTTTKTRIVSHNQQVVRVDREEKQALPAKSEQQIVRAIESLPDADAILVSDYAKGVINDTTLAAMFKVAASKNIPVIVDPKGRDFARYRGAFALTPNAKEAHEATGISTATIDGLNRAAELIMESTKCKVLAITRGAEGVALYQQGMSPVYLPTTAREVFDVTGAGDTFVAWMTMGCAAGLAPQSAAELANIAAGVVVSKSGAAVVSVHEIRAALMPGRVGRKMRQVTDLPRLGEDLRAAGKRIVFTNGCFDFLHAGHVAFLQQARSLGDVLVLATNTDSMITRLKGEGRPVIPQHQRLSLLASIEAVDYLVSFEDETPHALISSLRPELLVKGSNYSSDQVEGHEIVEGYGGEVRLLEVLPSIVTHELLAQRKS